MSSGLIPDELGRREIKAGEGDARWPLKLIDFPSVRRCSSEGDGGRLLVGRVKMSNSKVELPIVVNKMVEPSEGFEFSAKADKQKREEMRKKDKTRVDLLIFIVLLLV